MSPSSINDPVNPQSEGSILKLPVEILEMIAVDLDDYGLKSMRSSCRHLRIGTFYQFAERSTSSHVEIVTTNGRTAMRKLTVTLRSPSLVKARVAMTQLLALHDPLHPDEKHPAKTLVSNIVASNPDARTFQQQKNYRHTHEYCLAPLIFLSTLRRSQCVGRRAPSTFLWPEYHIDRLAVSFDRTSVTTTTAPEDDRHHECQQEQCR